jgi:lysozyme family protein
MSHPFVDLSAEYESWVAHAVPNHDRIAEINQVATRLTRADALARLGLVTAATKIPQVVMAPIGERECDFDFTKNWGQGDPLTHPSTHVPRGRPPLGAPPNDHFPVTWEFAAIDAFTVCDKLNVNSAPWSLAYACFKWEFYNGGGAGAGGVRTGTQSVTVGSPLTVTVGAGGSGAGFATGSDGANSVFSTITALKGGGGSATAPGGSSGQLQWNSSSSFGGISMWTTNGTNTS